MHRCIINVSEGQTCARNSVIGDCGAKALVSSLVTRHSSLVTRWVQLRKRPRPRPRAVIQRLSLIKPGLVSTNQSQPTVGIASCTSKEALWAKIQTARSEQARLELVKTFVVWFCTPTILPENRSDLCTIYVQSCALSSQPIHYYWPSTLVFSAVTCRAIYAFGRVAVSTIIKASGSRETSLVQQVHLPFYAWSEFEPVHDD